MREGLSAFRLQCSQSGTYDKVSHDVQWQPNRQHARSLKRGSAADGVSDEARSVVPRERRQSLNSAIRSETVPLQQILA